MILPASSFLLFLKLNFRLRTWSNNGSVSILLQMSPLDNFSRRPFVATVSILAILAAATPITVLLAAMRIIILAVLD